jgi:hypothetical protein
MKKEPIIIINGKRTTEEQAMTIRVALNNFIIDLQHRNCGDDFHGIEMVKLYRKKIMEIQDLMREEIDE